MGDVAWCLFSAGAIVLLVLVVAAVWWLPEE